MELTPVQTVYAKGIYDNHLPTVVLDHSKEYVLVFVRERSSWVRAMRIFQFAKTFQGWPLIYTDPILTPPPLLPLPPHKKKTLIAYNLVQPSPPFSTQKSCTPESCIHDLKCLVL